MKRESALMTDSVSTGAPEGAWSSDERKEKVEVNGRKLAWNRMGSGSPAVILETGLGTESDDWISIQRAVSEVTLVCRYDRVGRGESDAAPTQPRSVGNMVEDLHTLLRKAAIAGPCLLVGHSFGGLLVRLYAHRYPQEVSGLVLVDAMHPDQFDVIGGALPPATPEDPPALRGFREFWTGGWRDPKSTFERIDFATSFREMQDVRSLGQLPIHVITAATCTRSAFMPEPSRPGLQALWDELQRRFLSLSPQATQSFASNSGHFVQREQPEIIIDAIKALIERVRT